MVTVQTCLTLPEAQVVKSHLEGSGVSAFLPDEMTLQNDWLWTNALGGVRVQVAEGDYERALDVLREGTEESREPEQPDGLKLN